MDKISLPPAVGERSEASAGAALALALRSAPFLVMAGAYFVCGLQLLFITTHLPSSLARGGMGPMLGSEALGVIVCFNVLGSVFFGWAGGRWSKQALLGVIYTMRSLGLCIYFMLPATPLSTLLFAAGRGVLWLRGRPRFGGAVGENVWGRWRGKM